MIAKSKGILKTKNDTQLIQVGKREMKKEKTKEKVIKEKNKRESKAKR